eukprot:Awhi_evm1s1396
MLYNRIVRKKTLPFYSQLVRRSLSFKKSETSFPSKVIKQQLTITTTTMTTTPCLNNWVGKEEELFEFQSHNYKSRLVDVDANLLHSDLVDDLETHLEAAKHL